MTSYHEYVADERFMAGYAEYQKRYATQVRESDRVLIEIVRGLNDRRGPGLRLLDIGCSTGNLLLHLRNVVPGLELTGGDMVATIIEENRRNPDLAGIAFEEMDLLAIDREAAFDLVIANAVLYLLGDDELDRAVASVSRALNPQGAFLVFDFYHPFGQELEIVERTASHPDGLALHFRSYATAERTFRAHGFTSVDFHPFRIPINLPQPEHDDEIVSYTRQDETGEPMLFRGTLFQPWCHLVAEKG